MNQDDIKKYIVCINGGSGVIFQPMDIEYSYILTAKHVFEDVDSEPYNNLVTIHFFNAITNTYEVVKPPFELEIGENYFPHSEDGVDISIIKLPKIANVEKIIIKEDICIDNKDYCLSGYPSIRRNSIIQSINLGWFRADLDVTILTEIANKRREADISKNQNHAELVGSSGGGIVKIQGDYLVLAGIQSRVVSNEEFLGRIEFTPIGCFNEIIDEYKDKLTPLLPPYLANFSFLKDKVFNIDAGADDNDIIFTRNFLKHKANQIISSDITPVGIKDFFKERLILNNEDLTILNDEIIYATWLEFLVIMNIAKSKVHCFLDLEDLFNKVRLIYKNTNSKWQGSDFLKECMNCDLTDLQVNGTVLINTKEIPAKEKIEHYKIDKDSIIPSIGNLKKDYQNGNFGDVFIDDAAGEAKEFVFDKYRFIHFEFLKKFLITGKSEEFKDFNNSNQPELLSKLNSIYGELFTL
ncbi:ABC-three component system protein [Flavobacterium sp. Arc2]|uniref:ABC-three component system protein n=1 Tax=Flavobacterium sp. Arc2 TaxID=3046685 RepID=UPI00352D936D